MADPAIDKGMGEAIHAGCLLCGTAHPDGFRLQFTLDGDGVATATFGCDRRFAGYPGLIHGGVVASVLDSAMTNCLYLHGHTAVTAELVVRYHHGLAVGVPAQLRAWIAEVHLPVYHARATINQEGRRIARASARFMPLPR